MGRVDHCLRCGKSRPIKARGLCVPCVTTCYRRKRTTRDEELADFPRRNRTLAEFAEDFSILERSGMAFEQVAASLGYTPQYAQRNFLRCRAAGLLPKRAPLCGWYRQWGANAR